MGSRVMPAGAGLCLVLLAACGGGSDGGEGDGADETSTGSGEASEAGDADAESTADDGDTGDATTADTGAEEETSGDTTGEPPGEVEGCDGATLWSVPDDPSVRGPWPVGSKTVDLDGLTVEVWYPAALGSEAGVDPKVYDIHPALPDSEQDKIPDRSFPWQPCDCYEDLPIDDAHGPYPAVVFVHGTAGVRTQSIEITTHWASRGFIVFSADHPGLWLKDTLAPFCGASAEPQDLNADVDKEIAALRNPTGDLGFLEGVIDTTRLAVSGHSAGGGVAAEYGDEAQVLMPFAMGGVDAGSLLESTLIVGGMQDTVVNYSMQSSGYASSPPRKRLVGVTPAGHLMPSSFCSLSNADGQNIVEIGQAFDICGLFLAGFLFDCEDSYIDDPRGWDIVNYASSAVLEETLHCHDASNAFGELQTKFPEVQEFEEEL